MEAADKKIIHLCKEQKREGYNLLYQKYEKFIYKICYHYTASREDSLDLLQEIYIKLYKAVPGFNENYPVLPWIKKITVNTCLNFVRSKKDAVLSLNAPVNDGEIEAEELIASSVSVEDDVSFADTKKVLQEMINNLPCEMRMAVILRHIENMRYEDIARTMAVPLGTVKTLIFRGRKILKENLKTAGILEV